MKKFDFLVSRGDYTRRLSVCSKYLQGAIRKLYQQYDFDDILKILN